MMVIQLKNLPRFKSIHGYFVQQRGNHVTTRTFYRFSIYSTLCKVQNSGFIWSAKVVSVVILTFKVMQLHSGP